MELMRLTYQRDVSGISKINFFLFARHPALKLSFVSSHEWPNGQEPRLEGGLTMTLRLSRLPRRKVNFAMNRTQIGCDLFLQAG